MIKPCKLVELELMNDDLEKATFYFTELKTRSNVIFARKTHSILFNKLIEFMKSGEIFDFMSLSLESDEVFYLKENNYAPKEKPK